MTTTRLSLRASPARRRAARPCRACCIAWHVEHLDLDAELAQRCGAAGEFRRIEDVRRLVDEIARENHTVIETTRPSLTLPNLIVQKRARFLLARTARLF